MDLQHESVETPIALRRGVEVVAGRVHQIVSRRLGGCQRIDVSQRVVTVKASRVLHAYLVSELGVLLELVHEGVQGVLIGRVGIFDQLIIACVIKRVCLSNVFLEAAALAVGLEVRGQVGFCVCPRGLQGGKIYAAHGHARAASLETLQLRLGGRGQEQEQLGDAHGGGVEQLARGRDRRAAV